MVQAAKKTTNNIPSAGDTPPTIDLPTDGNAHFSLADYKGKNHVVVYFYPKDATPGCSAEARDFRDLANGFAAANTVVVGISKDPVTTHDKFKAKQELNFSLASDQEGDVCERYGVWVEKNMYGKKYMGIQRATFLIGKDGSIRHAWPKVKVRGHAQEVLEAVQKL